MSALIDTIVADNPFGYAITREMLSPIHPSKGTTGTAFLLTLPGGERFKLRVCPSAKVASRIAETITRAPQHFPALRGVDRNYVLIDYRDDLRELSKDDYENSMEALGKLCGEVTLSNKTGADLHDIFETRLGTALTEGFITVHEAQTLRAAFLRLAEGILVTIHDQLADFAKDNMMLAPDGSLIFVDEDAIYRTAELAGMGKLQKRVSPEAFARFLHGYKSITSFHPDPRYVEITRLIETLITLVNVGRKGRGERFTMEYAHLKPWLDS